MKKAIAFSLAITFVLVGLVLLLQPMTPAVAQNVTCYRMQGGAKWVAASGCEYEFQSGSTLDIQDGVTASTADWSVTDDLTVAGDLVNTPGTTIVVTPGGTVTPLGAYVPISSTAGAGTSAIAGPTAGRMIYIVNVSATTITFTDTGTLKLSGNIALGQYDTLTLRGDGTNWIQVGTSNN